MLRDRSMRYPFIVAVGAVLLQWIVSGWFVTHSFPRQTYALHYNVYFGVDLVGSASRMLLTPIFGLVVLFLNFGLSSIVYKREVYMGYVFAGATVYIELILLVSTISIALINR